MSNYYASCFYRIGFVVIPSYIELPLFNTAITCFFLRAMNKLTKCCHVTCHEKKFFFFCVGFFFINIHESQYYRGREREGISLTPLYHFHPLHRHLRISREIAGKSSPLHIASSRTRTGVTRN